MELKQKFNKNLESKLMSMEMDFVRRSARCSRLEKIRNNVIREKMNIKNSVLYYIRYKQLNWYATCKGWMKKGYLEKFWKKKKKKKKRKTWKSVDAGCYNRNVREGN